MMSRGSTVLALSAAIAFSIAGSHGAVAQNATPIDMVDFVVDQKDLVGKRVRLTGCTITGASAVVVLCTSEVASIPLEVDTIAREDLRRALRACSGFDRRQACRAEVEGTVVQKPVGLQLGQSIIHWASP